MTPSIRRATQSDAEALSLIGAATFLTTFAEVHTTAEITQHCATNHSVAAYTRLLHPPTDAWLVETPTTQAPVGYALLSTATLPTSRPDDLELKRIYLLPAYQGTGTASALMQQIIARAQERGANRLLLGVYAKNPRAIAYYQKHGFTKVADTRFMVGNTPYDNLVLALPLT